jgi:YVTN family beta-propeller protein
VNNTNIKNITVGKSPIAIAGVNTFNAEKGTIYVANYLSNTTSAISLKNNTKIGKDIPVGDGPIAIGVEEFTNKVHVANEVSNGISVIDPVANEVVARAISHISPRNSGYILCDGLPTPLQQFVYVRSGAKCTAHPKSGLEFTSWEENLKGNATKPITSSVNASSLDSLLEFLHLKSSEKPDDGRPRISIRE